MTSASPAVSLTVTSRPSGVHTKLSVDISPTGGRAPLTVEFFARAGYLHRTVAIYGPRGGELGGYDSSELRDLLCGRRDRLPARVSGGRDIRASLDDGVRTLRFRSPYSSKPGSEFRFDQPLLVALADLIEHHQLPDPETLPAVPASSQTLTVLRLDETELLAYAMRCEDADRDRLLRLADEMRQLNHEQALEDPNQRWQALIDRADTILARVPVPMTGPLLDRYLGEEFDSPQRLRAAAALKLRIPVDCLPEAEFEQVNQQWRAASR